MNEELIRLLREFPMFVGNGFSYFISDKKEPTCIAAADALESADKRIAELEAQLSECQKDAERYRWLHRQHFPKDLPIAQVVWKAGSNVLAEWVNIINGDDLNNHIDAAMRQEGGNDDR